MSHGRAVVEKVEIHVDEGEVVALFGANGVGKTTTLMLLAGELEPMAGVVHLHGKRTHAPLHRRARNGLALATEDRSIIRSLSARENLRLGRCDERRVLEVFPELEPLLDRRAGLLSGGEQQMLTLGRALARGSSLLLVDELSLGLAPLVVERLMTALRNTSQATGLGTLLVEQRVHQALSFVDRAYVMSHGRIVIEGSGEEVGSRIGDLDAAYLADERGPR